MTPIWDVLRPSKTAQAAGDQVFRRLWGHTHIQIIISGREDNQVKVGTLVHRHWLCMCVFVCVYMYTHACMYMCMCTCVCQHVNVCVYVLLCCMWVYTWKQVCLCVCVCTHLSLKAHFPSCCTYIAVGAGAVVSRAPDFISKPGCSGSPMCTSLGPHDALCCKVSVAPIVYLSDAFPSSRLILLSQPLKRKYGLLMQFSVICKTYPKFDGKIWCNLESLWKQTSEHISEERSWMDWVEDSSPNLCNSLAWLGIPDWIKRRNETEHQHPSLSVSRPWMQSDQLTWCSYCCDLPIMVDGNLRLWPKPNIVSLKQYLLGLLSQLWEMNWYKDCVLN